jgi:hypothetical protein
MSSDSMEDRDAAREAHTREIVAKLRQVDVLVSQEQGIVDAVRSIGVTEVTSRN